MLCKYSHLWHLKEITFIWRAFPTLYSSFPYKPVVKIECVVVKVILFLPGLVIIIFRFELK